MHYRLSRVPMSLIAIMLSLGGCATKPVTPPGTPIPSLPSSPNTPPSASADWENLGVSPNGNILNEIDKLSIKREGSRVTFRDRKTIFDLKKENFLVTPPHKASLNTWVIDCTHRTFKLINMELFDVNGRRIANFSYLDGQIKPTPVVQNSASYQQMLYVCPGVTKNEIP